jgi:hypothetical protein
MKKIILNVALVLVLLGLASTCYAAMEITPAVQKVLDEWKTTTAKWAADPAIVKAVEEQNAKGPIAGMDNEKWKAVRRSDPVVNGFMTCAAGKFLAEKEAGSKGAVAEAFVSGAQGEKVAFLAKTSKYIHKGTPKFDGPFGGTTWQGQPEFDESSQTYAVQVSVPVLKDGKPIGVLVTGINLTALGLASK